MGRYARDWVWLLGYRKSFVGRSVRALIHCGTFCPPTCWWGMRHRCRIGGGWRRRGDVLSLLATGGRFAH